MCRPPKKQCDIAIIGIFVNPTQFGPNEDLAGYPRTIEQDLRAAEAAGTAAVFQPAVQEMYPAGFDSRIDLTYLTSMLCGQSRPNHFCGVATVVTKLFNIVQPDKAFFGQKDAQQVLVIKQITADLNMPVSIETVPIVREADGLALSSRNAYLSSAERQAALVLSRSLRLASEAFSTGEQDCGKLKALVLAELAKEPSAKVDYAEIYSYPGLQPLNTITDQAILALAVFIGKTRLIDNIILKV